MTSKREDREALIGATGRLKALLDEGERCLCVAPGGEAFVDLRVLLDSFEQAHTPTDDELATLAEWLRQGAPFDSETWGQYQDQLDYAASTITDLRRPVDGTPTDDEREALAALIDPDTSRAGWNANAHDVRDQINGLHIKRGVYRIVDRILAAGFRRPVQGEPTERERELERTIADLGDELRIARERCDAALEVMNRHRCGEQAEAAYRRAMRAESRAQGEPTDALRSRIESTINRYETIYGGMRQMRYIIGDIRKDIAAVTEQGGENR